MHVDTTLILHLGRILRAGIETSPANKSLSISANRTTALSRDFGLRRIASVKCCPYIMLMVHHVHGPGPLHIVGHSKGSTLSASYLKAIGVTPVGFW